jgi:DoxX-like family
MTTAASPALAGGNSAAFPRRRMIAYWVTTIFLAGAAAIAGTMDILRIPPFFPQLLQLGYPAYFAAILGIWKVLGAIALLAPRYPLVKEWAYAGLFIDYTAALASWLVVGEGTASNLSGPILSIALLASSWALRPSSRRIAAQTTSSRP